MRGRYSRLFTRFKEKNMSIHLKVPFATFFILPMLFAFASCAQVVSNNFDEEDEEELSIDNKSKEKNRVETKYTESHPVATKTTAAVTAIITTAATVTRKIQTFIKLTPYTFTHTKKQCIQNLKNALSL